ncbi:MAG: hypothetical protein IRZ14_03565 [Chloroflexi bacterium]|nr:hypothetical protein [Chloroflexota bacterium]
MTTLLERLRTHLAAARATLAREQAEAAQELQAARTALARESERVALLRARLLGADHLAPGAETPGALHQLLTAYADAGLRRATLQASVESWAHRQTVLAEQVRTLAGLEALLDGQAPGGDEAALLADWLVAQERERERLASWLHDHVAQPLHHLVLQAGLAERCWSDDPARAAVELAAVPALAERLLAAVRRVIFELRPMSLADLGLVPTLERYIQLRATEEHLVTRLQVQGRPRRLPAATELALFRIVGAALDNVRDHAGTREARLTVRFGEAALELAVADSGPGCDLRLVEVAGRGTGLRQMRLRAAQIGGRIAFESAPGQGMVVRLVLPWRAVPPPGV